MSRERIHIVSVQADNFHRLRIAKLEHIPGQGLVRVTGPNASGKTSLLRAIMAALGGAGMIEKDVIHEGADKGSIILKLSNGYTIERRFTEASPKGYLTVVGPDQGKHSQKRLNGWLGPQAFDPLAFFHLTPDRQRDVLFSLGTDPELPQKLQKVRDEYARVYEERTPIISRRRHLAKIDAPSGDKPEPVDTSAELAKLRELQGQQQARKDALREAWNVKQQADTYPDAIKQAEEHVEDLKRQLAAAKDEVKRLKDNSAKAAQAADEALKTAQAMPDPAEQIDAIQARIEEAGAINAALEPWRRYEEAKAELDELAQQEREQTKRLDELKQREGSLLEEAGIPVDGLGFDETGEPLLNGRSLTVASGAELIQVAVQVALAANPDLRICLLDEANDLDLDAMTKLAELAEVNGFQIWCARLGLEGAGEVVIEDGMARDREPEVPS